MFLLNGLACGFLLLFAFLWSGYAILFFGICSMLMAITEVLLVDAMQNEIKEEGRATVTSFYGLGQDVVMIGFSLAYAALSGIFTLRQTYMLIGLYGITGGLVFYAAKSRRG
jgi:MFS family permease